ncbi:MAG: biotin--[acetyl-CoA-carboxylase] ligase [Methanobacteriota archaeon]
MNMDLTTIKSQLKTEILGRNLVCFKETNSTNAVAKNLAKTGAPEGLVVVAEVQTEGRGRAGHKWDSPAGGLWFSVLLRPSFSPSSAPAISLLAGLAVAKALRDLHFINAMVKWPNDVLVDGKKLCGILSEASLQGEKLDYIVVGIGMDVNNEASKLAIDKNAVQPTSVRDLLGKDADMPQLLAYVLLEMEKLYQRAAHVGFAPVIEEWTKLSDTIGKNVEIADASGNVKGNAKRVTPEGALVVDTGKEEKAVTGGDLRYV